MRMKKSLLAILILIAMILPMMTINVQAATLGKVYNLTSKMQGNIVYFSWSKVTNADGYDLYINTSNKGYEYIGSVTGTEAPVIGFKENETYLAKVCAYELNSNGTKQVGSFSTSIRVATETQTTLGKVTNLTAIQNGGNVTLNWSKVSNADGYQIFVDIPNFGYTNIGSVTSTNAIITGFTDGNTYGFKVRAYEKITSETLNYGGFSSSKTLKINEEKYENNISTSEKVEKPAKVTGLTIDEITKNKAYISWNNVSDADGYEIWLRKDYGSYQYKNTVYKNSATLSNLDYDTTYSVKVMAYKNTTDGKLYGTYSYKSFTTEKEEIELAQVKNVDVDVENNKAYIDWSKVTNADGYEIWLKQGNGNYEYEKRVTTTSTTITNLLYDKTYYVKVRAYEGNSSKEYGDFSSAVKFTTEEEDTKTLETVTNLTSTVINRNEAKLSWRPVDGADGYIVFLAKNGGSFEKITAENNYTTVYNLEYDTKYKAKVMAYCYVNRNAIYSEDYSNITSFKTETESRWESNEEVPRVQNVKANVTGDTVYLTWNKVSGAERYEIDFTVPGIAGSTKLTSYTNSRTISGLTQKNYNYTARIRAYKWVDGKLVAGPYSYVTEFSGK